MHTRGQGLSLNTIVIAAVVLIVLIVLIGFFTGYFGKWTGTFQGATDQSCSGELTVKSSCDPNIERQVFGNFKEVGPGQVCCQENDKPACPDDFCVASSTICEQDLDGPYVGEPGYDCPANRPYCCVR
jgi:hypothetical protein